jgi:hypothetical protein
MQVSGCYQHLALQAVDLRTQLLYSGQHWVPSLSATRATDAGHCAVCVLCIHAGQWLLSASGAASGFPARLAALQWAAFVVPSVLWIQRSGWAVTKTMKLQRTDVKSLLTGGS